MFWDTPECFWTLPDTDRQTALLDEKLGLHVAGRGRKNFGELASDTLIKETMGRKYQYNIFTPAHE